MSALRVPVDFNTMMKDDHERVWINTHVHKDLAACLRPGMIVTLWDTDLEVEAVVEFDQRQQRWWGRPDWSTSRDLPVA